ncbi:unnamed protein product [Larinioides sclopetarius]|uniref:Endonuclease/exonuclease/phosphatase domain-containing protein n=1 Tax=Larinioides sclopetarius TaxID=280406 RepID=A0AAV1YYW7_9ARAC
MDDTLLPGIFIVQEPYVRDNKIEGLPTYWKSWLSKDQKAGIIALPTCINPIFLTAEQTLVAIKILAKSKPLSIISSYSSPYNEIDTNLRETTNLITSLNEDFILGTDLNAHHRFWGYNDEVLRGEKVLNFITSHNAYILNTTNAPPTYQQGDSSGWPDLTITSNSHFAQNCSWEVLQESITYSGHKFIQITLNADIHYLQFQRFKTKFGGHRKLINILKPKIEQLLQEIDNTQTKSALDKTTITLQKEINKASSKAYKTKKIPVTPNIVWWSQNLQSKKNELKALSRRIQRSTNLEKSKWISSKENLN